VKQILPTMIQGAVMNKLVDCSGVLYAVIEALSTEAGSERFVVAYRNEQSLHDVIAAPCIIAFGFSSREEDVACTEGCVSVAAA
jgi:thymidylate synthase